MKNEFIPYEQALELKELGFDEECFGYYDIDNGYTSGYAFCYSNVKSQLESGCSAPLYQQAFRWFREKHILDFGIAKIYNGTDNYHYHINLEWQFFEGNYEEAELECLKKLIEIAKA
jgi:hypothetical protein